MGLMERLNSTIDGYDEQFLRIYGGKCLNGGGLFGTREAFLNIMPFKKEYGKIEDRFIYISFHKFGYRIGNVPYVLYNYRVHKSNTSLNPKNAYEMVSMNLELLFTCLFDSIIYSNENIIIVHYKQILKMIDDIFKTYFKDRRYHLIDEDFLNDFMNDHIYKFDPKKTVVFVGALFFNSLNDYLKRFGYSHLNNLFMLA